ncbi:hypothetical protein [Pseudomonas sp. GM25]|uniref:hypothetical protein n=1 Tax=Pseudomonas sp. GM25 TaxID=1144327 RepID=UPI0002702E91|nr:hypothetical protein [Pseudomonas sp. GM25]EJM24861.1 hypothetical protein PMI24_04513 [Pseudomonas sp. GM25]
MKTIIRHETEEDFFARMTSLARKLDRKEPVEAYESCSFEDVDEMNSFRSEQERMERKASLTLIAGGGVPKAKSRGPHAFVVSLHRFKNAQWILKRLSAKADKPLAKHRKVKS